MSDTSRNDEDIESYTDPRKFDEIPAELVSVEYLRRDRFAGNMMQQLLVGNNQVITKELAAYLAKDAVMLADALIEALEEDK